MAFLHAHTGQGGILTALEEIFLHGFLDTLSLVPFLFLTYLLMEFIEHSASDKTSDFMQRAGILGPLAGGVLGAVPQCGFSAMASNLYAGRVVTAGTLIAVFLSTSDEMLPILISGDVPLSSVLLILIYKAAAGAAVGFIVDFLLRLIGRGKGEINIDRICDSDNCHCERGIVYSALHHTVTISLFVLLTTFAINALVYFVGAERIGAAIEAVPFVSHIVAAVLGLIPNCAVSVALTGLFTEGIISVGTMLSGLFSGAGAGLLVLFRVNKSVKENLLISVLLVVSGVLLGLLGELIFPATLFMK